MKISYKKKASGFTLIEMIGVLAVIAILAALLIPKIFEAINNARINNACITIGTVKSAIADHYAKYGSLPYDGTIPTNITVAATGTADFDGVLLREQFIDKPFAVKVGTPLSDVRLFPADNTAGTAPALDGANAVYNLDGAAPNNDTTGSVVVEAVIPGVTELDAQQISERLDGPIGALTVAVGTAAGDTAGRVKYAAPAGGVTTVYVYLTHR
jgi:prepilin-type N-terminal cleavage/methylation domain-containing protein